jgi:DNA-binding LacI/PurR family transcriptional regulator
MPKKITIADIARELGISKTTVSRSISGKGRISEETREKVLRYIEEKGYSPNIVARGLAVSKTFNICVLIPNDRSLIDIPFFQGCLNGIVKNAEENFYDILICMVQKDDISQLKRIVTNRKVDGVIVMRPLQNDPSVDFLKSEGIPFLVIGNKEGTVQVDPNHKEACKALTLLLLTKGMKKIALIGASTEQCVTKQRYEGYCEALEQWKLPVDSKLVGLEAVTDKEVEKFTEKFLRMEADCIIGMDDYICRLIYRRLRRENAANRPMIASFYDNEILGENVPCALSVRCDNEKIGMTSSQVMIDMIEGRETAEKTVLGYDIVAR